MAACGTLFYIYFKLRDYFKQNAHKLSNYQAEAEK